MDKIKAGLSDIPETLLIPLWARAEELKRAAPIVRDEKAREILDRIDYDFGKFGGSWMSQLGISIRTMILDREAGKFLAENPGAVVVNIGCGLDARAGRLSGYSRWYDLDVPQAIELRRHFFAEDQAYRMLPKSVFDFSWMNGVRDEGAPILILAEGIMMYFDPQQVEGLFVRLAGRFPRAVVLLEMLAPFLVGRNKIHDAARDAPAFKWSLSDSRDMERWHPSIHFEHEWSYFDFYPERWRYFRLFGRVGFLRRQMNNRIVKLRFS